jgi:hypothetical protein
MKIKFPCGCWLDFPRHIAKTIEYQKNYSAFPCEVCEAKEEKKKFAHVCQARGYSKEEYDKMWNNGTRKPPKQKRTQKKQKKAKRINERDEFLKSKQSDLNTYLSGGHLNLRTNTLNESVKKFFNGVDFGKEDLKNHFDKCFEFWSHLGANLSRASYGKKGKKEERWEVDHVRPRAHPRYVDPALSDSEVFRDCFSLLNLRPTPTIYNRHKGNYYYGNYYYYDGGTSKKRNRTGKFKDHEVREFVGIVEKSFQKFIKNKKIYDCEWEDLCKLYQRFCC